MGLTGYRRHPRGQRLQSSGRFTGRRIGETGAQFSGDFTVIHDLNPKILIVLDLA